MKLPKNLTLMKNYFQNHYFIKLNKVTINDKIFKIIYLKKK